MDYKLILEIAAGVLLGGVALKVLDRLFFMTIYVSGRILGF